MINNEEKLFVDSYAAAIGLQKPVPVLREDFPDEAAFFTADAAYKELWEFFLQTRENALRVKLETGEFPQGVTGLIPDSSNKVSWRWEGQVFEDSPDDVLQHSIVVRNLQELGVDSIEALKYLFPQKTDEERAAMLNGYPFRVVGQVQQSINSFIGLLGNLYSIATPADTRFTSCFRS